MASELYSAIGANNAEVVAKNANTTQQNPREQAMNLVQQKNLSYPPEIANNPQALMQHFISTGQIQPNALQMAQQKMQHMLQRMFRR